MRIHSLMVFGMMGLLGGGVFSFGPLIASDSVATQFRDSQIQKLLKPYGTKVGLSVREWSSKKEISRHESERGFVPASVAKLVSSACTLNALGPSHQIETVFGTSGTITQGVLQGPLVVRGAGDPSLVIEDLRQIISYLRVIQGLKQIEGPLILDLSYFGTESLKVSDDFAGDAGRSFEAPLTALPFNHNSLSFWIVPRPIQPLVTAFPPGVEPIKILNQLKSHSALSFDAQLDYRMDDQILTVTGKAPDSGPPKAYYRAVKDPLGHFSRVFRALWLEQGGSWKNSENQRILKPVALSTILWTHRSKPISRQLMDINKLSTNFAAELLLLSAVAAQAKTPVNLEASRKFLSECVKSQQILPEKLALENASGLSRNTTFTPSALTRFLTSIASSTWGPEYLSTLSVLGIDGTTGKRLPEHRGLGRLKTGSIRGVRSIAGFLFPVGRAPLSFALIFNCADCADASIISIENQVISELLKP